jgi:protein-S-isoprenylcysteine O-methyltransferase Ste14
MSKPQDPSLAPSSIPWPPVLLVLLVVAAIALGHLLPLAWPGQGDMAGRVAGLALGAAGIALLVWASATLHRHGTAIWPSHGADVLVTDGPFRVRRNPIYIAHVLILLGVAEATRNVWFALLAVPYVALVTWLAVLPEERHLEARFGEAYREYKSRTRRWI